MRLGFVGLGIQHNELLESNKKLNQKLDKVVKELNVLKKNEKKGRLVRIDNGYRSGKQSHRKFIGY